MRRAKRIGRFMEERIRVEKRIEKERMECLAKLEEELMKICSKEEFLKTLFRIYNRLKFLDRMEEPLPIPKVKKEVCKELGMQPERFQEFMQIIELDGRDYRISLLPPEVRDSGGIMKDGKYYHRIIIRKNE
jgi:hypothetical protein